MIDTAVHAQLTTVCSDKAASGVSNLNHSCCFVDTGASHVCIQLRLLLSQQRKPSMSPFIWSWVCIPWLDQKPTLAVPALQ